MLPPEAKAHLDSILSRASTDAYRDLAEKKKEFQRSEFSRGQRPNGGGYAARLSVLYRDCLSLLAKEIAKALIEVHKAFNSPLDKGVDAQLKDWGDQAIATAYQNLEEAFLRHLNGFGIQPQQSSGLDYAFALAKTTVANLPSSYLWELRNVPAKHPHPQPVVSPQPGAIIQNYGTIGAVQTGADSTANA